MKIPKRKIYTRKTFLSVSESPKTFLSVSESPKIHIMPTCVYVYVSVIQIYVHTDTHMYTHLLANIYYMLPIYTDMYRCTISLYMCTLHTHLHIYVHNLHTHTHTHTHTIKKHIYTYIYIYIYTCIYIYIYV
jgi:hypothetical protein